MKQIVGKELAKRVVDADVIGLGSGTTVLAAIEEIGKRIKEEGINVSGIPTSVATAHAAEDVGLQAAEEFGCLSSPEGAGGGQVSEKLPRRRKTAQRQKDGASERRENKTHAFFGRNAAKGVEHVGVVTTLGDGLHAVRLHAHQSHITRGADDDGEGGDTST